MDLDLTDIRGRIATKLILKANSIELPKVPVQNPGPLLHFMAGVLTAYIIELLNDAVLCREIHTWELKSIRPEDDAENDCIVFYVLFNVKRHSVLTDMCITYRLSKSVLDYGKISVEELSDQSRWGKIAGDL